MVRTSSIRALAAAALTAAVLVAAPAGVQAATNEPSASQTGCFVQVGQTLDVAREDAINDRIMLAKEFYSVLPEEGFSSMSCLERLLNGGMDIFFKPPGMGDLLGMLENAICRKANQMFAQATAPINRSLNASLKVGEIIPGVNLGSINGGVNIRARSGNGGIVSTNVGGVLTGNKTYQRQRWEAKDLGGGLFGN